MKWTFVNPLMFFCVACQCQGSVNTAIDVFHSGSEKKSPSYRILAEIIRTKLEDAPNLEKIEKALVSLSSAQHTLKGLDGAAHEAYQRTHRNAGDISGASGRAKRSAARAGSTADALLAAELTELLENPDIFELELDNANNINGTLAGRLIVANVTQLRLDRLTNISCLVLYEPSYTGGSGLDHGGIDDLAEDSSAKSKGRLLVVVSDSAANDLTRIMDILDSNPLQVGLHAGLVANEVASVQPALYHAAGRLVRALEPLLENYNSTEVAIHFVGRSLAGGVASLAATILDGSLPLPSDRRMKSKRRGSRDQVAFTQKTANKNFTRTELEGFGRGRSSAMVLGTPPCLSANVKAAFVKSIIYGDDVVCRTTHDSLERLVSRTKKALKGGILGRNLGWVTDTVSLTVSSMSRHAQGSEGEEERLSVPGQAFLIRPRRLGGTCSMHEVGGQKGGREALRAAILWQLSDILLSSSFWKHHQLDSYIHGLAKVQLRGVDDKEQY